MEVAALPEADLIIYREEGGVRLFIDRTSDESWIEIDPTHTTEAIRSMYHLAYLEGHEGMQLSEDYDAYQRMEDGVVRHWLTDRGDAWQFYDHQM